MKIIRQITLYFLIIFLVTVAGLGIMLNRVHKTRISHQRLIEEWKELRMILTFIQNVDETLTMVSVATPKSLNTITAQNHLITIAGNLESIRSKSLESEKFEEDEHALMEREDFWSIYEEYQKFLSAYTINQNIPAEMFPIIKLKLMYHLNKIKEAGFNLQNFYIEGMGEASGTFQKTNRQIFHREIGLFIILLFMVGSLVLWFISLLKQNTHDMIKKEKGATIGLLAQGLAHEIRNPLGIISTSASVVKEKLKKGSDEYQLTEGMIDEVNRINQLVEQLLHLDGKQDQSKRRENPSHIIEEVIKLIITTSQKNKTSVNFEQNAGEKNILCNRNQIKQVLLNILLNGIQASSPNGNILIKTYVQNKMYAIEIHDDGPGFNPKDLERAFEPFFTTKNNGTGLGLFIAKNIIEFHKGSLTIHSKQNVGTTISILLPLTKPEGGTNERKE